MEKVSLLKVNSYEADLQTKIVELLEPLGGLGAFCRRGEKVLLKPNFLMARPAADAVTTHPAIIKALCSLLKDLGCRIAIGDGPGIGSTEGVLRRLNLLEDLKSYQVEVVEFLSNSEHGLERKKAFDFEAKFKNLRLASKLNEYDRIINLPKLKTHGQMGISLATKNLYGCVAGTAKGQWHYAAGKDLEAFAQLLVEIALTVNPELQIMDGIVGMDGNGPANGRPRELGVLAAATNPLALDRVIVELVGQKPEYFPIFAAAAILKVPGLTLEEIEVVGAAMGDFKIENFEIPVRVGLNLIAGNQWISRLFELGIRRRLKLDRVKCIKCRKCEELCPAKAITFPGEIKIDEERCIKCCCCQEMCPVGALTVHDPWLAKALQKVLNK